MLYTQVEIDDVVKSENAFKVYIKELKEAKVDVILVSVCEFFSTGEERTNKINKLAEGIKRFEDEGFQVAVWTNTLGYGIERDKNFQKNFQNYAKLTSFDGKTSTAVCTLDKPFLEFMQENIRDFARAGVKIILLDDDLVQSVRPGFLCTCEKHLQKFEAVTGRKWTRDEVKALFTGEPNELRTQYIKIMGDSMYDFCKALRDAADEISKDVRIGLCASYTHYDIEGVDIRKLLSILAGENNKPFFRLSGAPYWPAVAQRYTYQTLGDVVDFIRMQMAWLGDADIEIFDENDVAPRNHFWVPTAYQELYDKLIMASGNIGRHKYFLCVDILDEYADKSYLYAHKKNMADDDRLVEMFKDKQPCGYRIWHAEKAICQSVLPEKYTSDAEIMNRFSYPKAGFYMSRFSVPVQYNSQDVAVISDDDATFISPEDYKNGLLMDCEAAKILSDRAVDIGIEEFEFDNIGEISEMFCTMKPKANATVLSYFEYGGKSYPEAIAYENSQGQKFVVLAWNMKSCTIEVKWHLADRAYSKRIQESIAKAYEYISNKKMPAFISDCPGLYVLASKNDDATKMSILLCNIYPDCINEPTIELDNSYSVVSTLRCDANINGNKLTLSDIQPYSFVAIELELQ